MFIPRECPSHHQAKFVRQVLINLPICLQATAGPVKASFIAVPVRINRGRHRSALPSVYQPMAVSMQTFQAAVRLHGTDAASSAPDGGFEVLTLCLHDNYICCGAISEAIGSCCDSLSGGFTFTPNAQDSWFQGASLASCPASTTTVTVMRSSTAASQSSPADTSVAGGSTMTSPPQGSTTSGAPSLSFSPLSTSSASQGAAAAVDPFAFKSISSALDAFLRYFVAALPR